LFSGFIYLFFSPLSIFFRGSALQPK